MLFSSFFFFEGKFRCRENFDFVDNIWKIFSSLPGFSLLTDSRRDHWSFFYSLYWQSGLIRFYSNFCSQPLFTLPVVSQNNVFPKCIPKTTVMRNVHRFALEIAQSIGDWRASLFQMQNVKHLYFCLKNDFALSTLVKFCITNGHVFPKQM